MRLYLSEWQPSYRELHSQHMEREDRASRQPALTSIWLFASLLSGCRNPDPESFKAHVEIDVDAFDVNGKALTSEEHRFPGNLLGIGSLAIRAGRQEAFLAKDQASADLTGRSCTKFLNALDSEDGTSDIKSYNEGLPDSRIPHVGAVLAYCVRVTYLGAACDEQAFGNASKSTEQDISGGLIKEPGFADQIAAVRAVAEKDKLCYPREKVSEPKCFSLGETRLCETISSN